MIKLGKLTDYAVVIITQISMEDENNSSSANYLSEKTNIPEPTVAKILKKLSHGNVLTSVRGASGGYRLSRSINDISLADVIIAMEGPIAIVDCATEEKNRRCFARRTCSVKHSWCKVNSALVFLLDSMKLGDMMLPYSVENEGNRIEIKVSCRRGNMPCSCDNDSSLAPCAGNETSY